jgi:NIMA (never in mitosis gene a)-related kinase
MENYANLMRITPDNQGVHPPDNQGVLPPDKKAVLPPQVLYLCVDAEANFYVIKEIDTTQLLENQIQMKNKDIDFMKRFNSPYIISIKEAKYFPEQNKLYIVQEYVHGPTLLQFIRKRHSTKDYINESKIIKILICFAYAIKHIHDNGAIHRNIKPGNIFLHQNGIVKLGGFGVSRLLGPDDEAKTFCGTPLYVPPEIWEYQRYKKPCDLWSLGIVIHELCSLLPPFKGKNVNDLRTKVINNLHRPIPKQYSEDLRTLVNGFLSKKPLERPSCDDILNLNFINREINALSTGGNSDKYDFQNDI